eukprot:3176591-Alexandrium_andersonii.AAC.1
MLTNWERDLSRRRPAMAPARGGPSVVRGTSWELPAAETAGGEAARPAAAARSALCAHVRCPMRCSCLQTV